MASRILVDLDELFLCDDSAVFSRSLKASPIFGASLAEEEAFEREQLEWYPVAFQRVRGFPQLVDHEELTRIQIREWTTMAIKLDSAVATKLGVPAPHITHPRMYFEVELFDFEDDLVVGWTDAARFAQGVLQGFSALGVGDGTDSWGARCNMGPSRWAPNDVLGCAADMIDRRLTYSLNGKVIAMQVLPEKAAEASLVPAFTANNLDALFNFGSLPFHFPPPGKGYRSIYRSISS